MGEVQWERLPIPQSPIEQTMYDALRCVASYEYGFDVAGTERGLGTPLTIQSQVHIGRYCVDFLVSLVLDKNNFIKIIVECDGHEFHEKNKDQISRDKLRDRWLQRQGYLTQHFSGADIYKDSFGCAREVIGTIMDWYSGELKKAACQ